MVFRIIKYRFDFTSQYNKIKVQQFTVRSIRMPTTRKKDIKTVYKDEDDSEADAGDFSDSGSEAVISQPSSSDDDEPEIHDPSDEENKSKRKHKCKPVKKQRFVKTFTGKVSQQSHSNPSKDESDSDPKEPAFSVKDLTDADKLLPSFLNLSESDSSDEEDTPKPKLATKPLQTSDTQFKNEENEMETCTEYKDVWSNNLEQSEEIAKKTFLELEKHKSKLEETKLSIQKYTTKKEGTRESDVNDLLALGEDVMPSVSTPKIKKQKGKRKNDSDSEMEDWEEVAEGKTLPQQGLQLIVDFPGAACRKSKTIDVEMMMKRKINRVKKEYQVYMHKVHVLCWLGHGNYVSQVLNDQDVLAAALSLMPSKECYPGERVDMKYVEQITTWFKDKLTVKFDKNEGKFRPKAPPLKNILLQQIQSRAVTSKKYIVFIFVSMLRAVGLQCRIMLNFTTLPIKPPSTELCSLSTKPKANETSKEVKDVKTKETKKKVTKKSVGCKIPQLDGNYDTSSDSDFENIMQVDGNSDASTTKGTRASVKAKSKTENNIVEDVSPPKKPRRNLSIKKTTDLSKSLEINVEDISPPKRPRRNLSIKKATDLSKSLEINDKSNSATASKANKKPEDIKNETVGQKVTRKSLSLNRNLSNIEKKDNIKDDKSDERTNKNSSVKSLSLRKSKISKKDEESKSSKKDEKIKISKKDKEAGEGHETKLEKKTLPNIIVIDADTNVKISSKYFENGEISESKRDARARKRSHTSNPAEKPNSETNNIEAKKPRAKSAPSNSVSKSKYFENNKTKENVTNVKKVTVNSRKKKVADSKDDDSKRVSHKDLMKTKSPTKNDVTNELVNIIKKRVREAKTENKKGKNSKSSDEDSDYLPEITEEQKVIAANKTKSKSGGRKIDRRVLSTDDEAPSRKIDVWCEIFVEELEQWIAVDVIKGRAHCVNEIYSGATHPVNYVVGWDNNNYLKDLTRRYVPHWNTITRKQRVEPSWWNTAIQPWVGPRTARDREEDDCLDRMQLDAPLPKSIAEYKNHPLYALKRHLLKFEAIYPPDAATLGFVRGEPVYARDCVYVCRSRDTWLKEAKVVRLGEQPYKVVKARPKWDKLSNKLITDKPLEVFGPWQVQDYEPPTAENGIVPRNAYGNVELFKECMLPKGTAHIKLPGLNRVAKKLNIDCAPAMTGFDFNGGWSHPVYDGFVVCKEFEDIIINAWHEDQEEQERKEQEKLEARVYGNWRRLIKGLLIKERLKLKYGFTEPTTSQESKKRSTGPRLTVKKKC